MTEASHWWKVRDTSDSGPGAGGQCFLCGDPDPVLSLPTLLLSPGLETSDDDTDDTGDDTDDRLVAAGTVMVCTRPSGVSISI